MSAVATAAPTRTDQAVDLPLAGAGAQRLGDAAIGLAAVLTRHAFAAFFVSLAVHPGLYGAHPAAGGRVLAGSIAAFVYAFGRWGGGTLRRSVALDARLAVSADAVTVHQRAMLKAPVTIPRDQVRAVAFDDAEPGRRFPIRSEHGNAVLLWLWQPRVRALPVMHPGSKAPNVALMFEQPIDLPRRGLRRARGEAGLLMPVADVEAARAAFAPWGVTRALGVDDSRHMYALLRRGRDRR